MNTIDLTQRARKELERIELLDDLSKQMKWRNLYFDKNGSRHWARQICNSEKEAIEKASKPGDGRVELNGDCVWRLPDGSTIKGRYSHFIPMPIGAP